LALLRAAPVILLGSVTMNLHLAFRKFNRMNPSAADSNDNFPKYVHLIGLGLWIASIGDILFGVNEFNPSDFYYGGGLVLGMASKIIYSLAIGARKKLLKKPNIYVRLLRHLISFVLILLVFKNSSENLPIRAICMIYCIFSLNLFFGSWSISRNISTLFIASILFLITDMAIIFSKSLDLDMYVRSLIVLIPYYLAQFYFSASTINFKRDKFY
jgi:uncharacterized membrane protein YhhN